ncbi:MAG: hypothetical protein ACTSVD_05795 [Candidatus Thorarchaeota archaeon]|nr:MAG: hypothetical protein DRO93_11175 [Candidatus Thorarchaeota archaeon]
MDYNLVLSIAAHAGFFISLFSVALFHRTYRFVAPTVGARTRHSLVLFAVAALWYTVSPLISLYFFDIGRLVFSLGVALLANSVSEIYFESDRAVVAGRVFTVLYVIMSVAVFFYARHLFVIMGMVMSLIIIAMMYVAAKIHMVSPSPYSVSVFAISGLTVGLAYLLHTGLIFNNPQYFAILVLPTSLISAFLVSVNRSWRHIVNLTVVYFALGTSVPLVVASLLSGEFGIYSLVMTGAMAVMATVIPLNYFLIEAGETRARTPYFLAVTFFSLAFLISTHYVNWAFAFGTTPYTNTDPLVLLFTVIRGQWDYMIVYTDWLLGLIAITSFLLAGIATTYSEKAINRAIDAIIVFDTALVVLGAPPVNAGRYELNVLYVPLVLLIVVAVITFARVAIQLRRSGQGTVARRFVLFIMGALSMGMVAMFSDRLVLIGNIALQLTAIVLLTLSAPAEAIEKFGHVVRWLRRSRREVR